MGISSSQYGDPSWQRKDSSGVSAGTSDPLDYCQHPDALSFFASVQRKGWDTVDHILDDEESDDYLEAPEGLEILAAAYLIACLLDGAQPEHALAKRALETLASDRSGAREIATWALRARHGVSRVLSEDSELRENAEASGDWQSWASRVEELLDRLR